MKHHATYQYTQYNYLTDEELFAVCDNHYNNTLVVELRQRLEEATDDLQRLEGLLYSECPKCEADLSDIY